MEQSHVMNLMFCTGASAVSLVSGNYITVYTQLVDGDIYTCNDQNMVVDATSVLTDDRVSKYGLRLVGRRGTKLVYSDLFKTEDVITYNAIATAAAAEQVTYIGYTGAANSISVVNDNTYKLNLTFYQLGRTGQGRLEKVDVSYHSDDSATQTSVAFGIVDVLSKTLAKQPEPTITVRLINSAALDANHLFEDEFAVVQGSKYITSDGDLTTDDTSHTAVAGDLVRLGTAADAVGAVALGSTVYKIISVIGTTILELDRPVTTATGAYTEGSHASLIPAATIGNYGIRLDGVAQTWILGKRPWQKIMFSVGLLDFGTTAITESTRASLGRGLINQMKDLEWFCEGESGNKYRGDHESYIPYTSQATLAAYDQIAITWASDSRTESIGDIGNNPKQLIIGIDPASHNGDVSDLMIEVLDAYLTLSSGLAH